LAQALEGEGALEETLTRHRAPPPPSRLTAQAPAIESAFARFDPAAIRASLADVAGRGSQFAAEALAAFGEKSPTSQAIALRQMSLGGDLDFEAAMAIEYRIVSRICRGHDFYEGVRATIIDKDNRPNWRPGRDEPLPAEAVDAYFAPLGADELTFAQTPP
jgi:enoyl-CoA hydratase